MTLVYAAHTTAPVEIAKTINFLNLLVMVNTPPQIENKFAEKLRFILKKQQ
ncbi:MAG: hypothetical protein V7K65_05655 [Nostoc sp.]